MQFYVACVKGGVSTGAKKNTNVFQLEQRQGSKRKKGMI